MPKYEHAVQVAEFSKDSLKQLKKAFAPSLESIFEARKAASDAGAESTAKKVGGTGIMAVLLKAFKRLAVVVGLVIAGLVALVSFLGKPGDPTSLLGNIAAIRAFFRMKWIKMPEMKGFKESMTNWKKGWNNFITNIKESKFVTETSSKWTAMMESLKTWRTSFKTWRTNFTAKWITPVTQLFDGPETTAKPDAAGTSKLKDFFARIKQWKIWYKAKGLMGWLNKMVYPLWITLTTLDAHSEWVKEGDAFKASHGDPETMLDKFKMKWSQLKAYSESNMEAGIDKFIVGTAGILTKLVIDHIMPDWMEEFEIFSLSPENKKLGALDFGEMWAKKFGEWRRNLAKSFDEWLADFGNYLENFVWDGDTWAEELDEFVFGVLGIFKDWIMNKIKSIIPKKWWPEDAKNQQTGSRIGADRKPIKLEDALDNKNLTTDDMIKGSISENIKPLVIEGLLDKQKTTGKSHAAPTDTGAPDFGLYPSIKPISAFEKWKKVFISTAVSDKNMAGTVWNRFGGWDKITNGILNVWNSQGFTKPPVFTSGKRTIAQNKAVGGEEDSRHLTGEAFDLRNRDIPINKRQTIFDLLLNSFGGKVTGTRHAELDGTKKQHFHFKAAAEGYFGKVTDPTLFLTGESGPENVIIQPARDPSQQTNFMRQMGADISGGGMVGQMGGITTVVDASSNTSNATVLAVGNGPHPAPIDDGLHR